MDRRKFLCRFGTATAAAALPLPSVAQNRPGPFFGSDLRGTTSALDYGIVPGALDDQSAAFQAMLRAAAHESIPIFLPAGNYVISNIQLPSRVVLRGVPGATNLIYGGDGYLFRAEDTDLVMLESIMMDGANKWSPSQVEGLVDLRGVTAVTIEGCTLRGASANALYMERCEGFIRENSISGAARFGIFGRESNGLTITDNNVENCAGGGIVIHRWSQGHDGSVIKGNRISDIWAAQGGTGQWGNAINVFRTDDVIISDNIISNSAFSAIRANSTRGVQIVNNNCRESGETAIYAEFSFENAVVANNLVDRAANGISITNFDNGGRAATVSGNIVRNLTREGPYEPSDPGFGTGISVEADTTVIGNMIEGAPLFGINAGWGKFLRDVVISGNVIRSAQYGVGVSAVAGAGTALVKENIISARDYAILAHEWGRPAAPDLARTPDAAPTNILVSGNTVTQS